MLQVSSSSSWPLTEFAWVCFCLPCTREPRPGPSTAYVSHQCWIEEKDDLSWPVGKAFPLVFFAIKAQYLNMINMLFPRIPNIFFFKKLLSSQLAPTCADVWGYASPHAIPLLNFFKIPVCPFVQLVKVPLKGSTTVWCVNHYSELCTICKLAQGALVPSSRSWRKVLQILAPISSSGVHHFKSLAFCLFFYKSNLPQDNFFGMSLKKACSGKLFTGSGINTNDPG